MSGSPARRTDLGALVADRRIWTEKERKFHVAAYRASGQLMRDYCAPEGMPGLSSLSRWCRRISESGRSRPRRRSDVEAVCEQPIVLSAGGSVEEALRQDVALLKKLLAKVLAGEV